MQPRDQEALAIYQETKHEPRAVAERLLEQFFNAPSRDEYERDLDVIRQVLERKS
jgi:hypothetical protein